jgi:hypothetical protein
MTRSNVDLPHPEGPISAMNSPSSIARSIPFRISVESKILRTALSSIFAISPVPQLQYSNGPMIRGGA